MTRDAETERRCLLLTLDWIERWSKLGATPTLADAVYQLCRLARLPSNDVEQEVRQILRAASRVLGRAAKHTDFVGPGFARLHAASRTAAGSHGEDLAGPVPHNHASAGSACTEGLLTRHHPSRGPTTRRSSQLSSDP